MDSLENYPKSYILVLSSLIYLQMKIWSSHLLDNLSNCLVNLKNSGDSTGFEPMTSAMPSCLAELEKNDNKQVD